MLRRLPWLVLLLAVAGAAWMLHDSVLRPLTEGLERYADEPEGEDDETALADEASLEEAWDAAPRLVGRGRSGEAGGPSAGAGGDGAAAATGGGDATRTATLVRFGGTVRGPDGRAAAGVTVTITDARSPWAPGTGVETNANGRFALELPVGRYHLALRAGGLGGLYLPNYLVDGATGADIELDLQRLVRLEVRLLEDDGGLPEAEVSLAVLEGVGGEVRRTDATGTALFEEVVSGTYRLLVRLATGEEISRRLDLRRDQVLEIALPPRVAIRGLVENGDEGGAVAGALVTASVRGPAGTWITVGAESEVDGHYEVRVPRGTVGRFEAAAEGFAPWPARRRIRTVLRQLSGVAKGRDVEMRVSLQRGLVLAGRVTEPGGDTVADVALSFKPRRGPALTATSDADGAYEVRGVRPDRYDVVVLSEGWFSDAALRVTVPSLPPGERFVYDVTVHPTLAVAGRVVHANDAPAAGAHVWITAGGRVLRAARQAGRELETFADPEGRWRITDLPPNQGVAARASLGALEARPRGFRTDAIPAKPLRLVLAPTVRLRGTVVDLATGQAVERARVVARPRGAPGGRSARSVLTDAEGRFELFELIPGAWELTPSRVGYLTAPAESIDLRPDDREREVTLRLDPGLAVGGVVLDLEGRPLQNAHVTVSGTTREGKNVRRRARTLADGAFRITGFESGGYRLRARRSGYRDAWIQGLQGGEERLVVRLRPRPR